MDDCAHSASDLRATMTLTFLGTGTSTGVPQPLCDCQVCRSADMRDNRMRTSALLRCRGKNILLDCGPDFRTQILRAGNPHLDALIITHTHYDHLGGIDDLRPYCPGHHDGFPIYCRADVAADIRARMPYCFGDHPYPGAPRFDIHVIDTEPFFIDDIEITPLPVMHKPDFPITGFRVGPLSYVTDCKIMPRHTIELIRGSHTFVINALRHTAHPSHLNLQEALDVISEVRPSRALLTHISHSLGRHADIAPTLPEGVMLAYDSLTLDIDI